MNRKESAFKFIPLVAIAFGFLLVIAFAVKHAPVYIQSLMVKTEAPESYQFPVYDQLLREFVHDGNVDYKNLKSSPLLDKAIHNLERISDKNFKNTKDRLCYWINAYNLLTLKMIADNYPIETVTKLTGQRSSRRFIVGGKTITVQRLRYEHLRALLRDPAGVPEAIFLLCDGSRGSPPLTGHALKPAKLRADAQAAVYKFVKKDENAYFDYGQSTFYLSPIFAKYDKEIAILGQTPHEFAAFFMEEKRAPILTVTTVQTYYRQLDDRLNDSRIIPTKGKATTR